MAIVASLRNQILTAENEAAIKKLLAEGNSAKFRFASNKTRNKWKAVATKRKGELHLKREPGTIDVASAPKKRKKKSQQKD